MGQKHIHHLHRGLHAVHFSTTAGLAVLAAGVILLYSLAPSAFVQAGSGNTAFASSSAWNTSLPRYPQIAGNSGSLVQNIVSQVASYGSRADVTDRGAPLYIADNTTPTVTVTPWACDGPADMSLAGQWSAVPIPFYAQPSTGAGRMLVFQPTTQTYWEFSGAYTSGGQWFACHGGRIDTTSISSGTMPGSYGVTASGLAQMAGQISVADIQRGRIDHAIGLSLPQLGGGVSWPATRSSGGGLIAAGTRLQLDPNIDITSLGLSAYGRLVAQAAQTYGFIVWDTANQVSVLGENPLTYTTHGAPNPYGSTSISGFPWDKLRALPADYGVANYLPELSGFSASATAVAAGQPVTLTWQSINISECALPGVASHLGPSGSVTTQPLAASTAFTIACSGPNGSVTRSLNVTVPTGEQALPPPPPQAVNITNPVGGSVRIVAELFDPAVLSQIYKVAYYERGNLLQVTTDTPFNFVTHNLPDGKHQLSVHLFFRDGHDETQTVAVQILNHPASLLAAHPLSKATPSRSLTPYLVLGFLSCMAVMGSSAWWGWRKGHIAG